MRKRRKTKKIVLLFLPIILFILVNALIYLYCFLTPKLEINKRQSYYLYDSSEVLVFGSDDNWVNLNNISENLINATIATEDKYFYKHIGFDYLRIGADVTLIFDDVWFMRHLHRVRISTKMSLQNTIYRSI